ncbi:MAG TPA: ABC transporter permease [Rhabdochlamydiaceae bacterium]|nr:ABC transporter permease [Rhabdochlamydiaceae bacterium]
MKLKFIPKPPKSELPFAIGIPALVWQMLFFYVPLLLLLISSFIKVSETETFQGFTFEHIGQFLTPTYLKVIASSLILAVTNVILCFLIAYPLAYFIAFRGKKYKNLLLFFLIVPFWTNFLLHVYAWFYVLEKQGFLNNFLISSGLIQQPLHLLNTPFAIMVMMVYYYLPYMVLPIYASLENFNYSLIEASYDLGSNFFQTFRRIMLPLTRRGILAGFFLVYVPSFGEFAIPELMGGDKQMFVGNVVSEYILGMGTGSLGSAFTMISAVFLLISIVFFFFLINSLLLPRKKHG